MRSVSVGLLQPQDIDQAFPLIAAELPLLSRHRWRDLANKFIPLMAENDGGILIARSENGYLTGLCLYWRAPHGWPSRALLAESFAAMDMMDTAIVVEAMTAALTRIAQRSGCETIRALVPSSRGGLTNSLLANGFRADGAIMNLSVQPSGLAPLG